ncbi:MAG: hypothetical protein JF888_15040 [Candidatus Dormibacteraeota bacterium]|uniref:Uncharacterized protein n=1 Tax=Candidatus Dormiibacter inghamiae TaxID=3127013 RepID=A0A934N878_9BACT|nr:hypothetical protein [Candidatus Dormibacteraeota bacterium]
MCSPRAWLTWQHLHCTRNADQSLRDLPQLLVTYHGRKIASGGQSKEVVAR